ncbi:MAG TPA: O-antigen ligase family protein [Candidatus Aquabacterium excrementipullorum]|nr:O-antigen ligase family protein [Candidatus Aquabacterium excrementipullorum]
MKKFELPTFYAIPIFLAIALKSGVDAFFEVNSVKYLYFLLLLFGVFFLRTGRGFTRTAQQPGEVNNLQSRLWVFVMLYFTFLTLVMILQNGSPQMVFKIVSPFIFFGLLIAAQDKSLAFAMALGAALNILVNAAFMPFDYGWVYWGGIRTFKGFYMFKTDLSYSMAASVLVYAAWNRYKPTLDFLLLAAIAVVMVVLANSRANYLTMALVLAFIAYKNGTRPALLAGYAAFLGLVGGLALFLYDPQKYLGFDMSNMGSFTQGRDRIAEVLLRYGLATYGPLELLFGKGLYADLLIYMENVSDGEPNGAHNDFLYQITTQGIFGLAMNVFGWYLVYRITMSKGRREWARGLIFIAFAMYIVQGLTMAVSLYALKTWPLAMILLLVHISPDALADEVSDKKAAVAKRKRRGAWGIA